MYAEPKDIANILNDDSFVDFKNTILVIMAIDTTTKYKDLETTNI